MNENTERYNQSTKAIAKRAAGEFANLLSGYNISTNQDFTSRLENIFYTMLVDYRQFVINDRLQDERLAIYQIIIQESNHE
jgi:hypothetical protein